MGKKIHTAPGPFSPATYLATFFFSVTALGPALVHAQEPSSEAVTPEETSRAMPGIVRLPLPVPTHAPLAVSLTGGYGWIDPMYDLQDSGHRLEGLAAIAYSPVPYLVIGADAWGRMDHFSDDDDPNATNRYGEPRLTARFQRAHSTDFHYGAELGVRFIGGEAPNVTPRAISPSLQALIGARLAPETWLAAGLGFHLDNSRHPLPDPDEVNGVDRITLGASSSPSVPWGVGVSHRLASNTELLGELSGDILVGGNAPSILDSPWGLSLGARHPVHERISVMLSADVSFSARPDLNDGTLVPTDPRIGGFLTVTWRPFVEAEAKVEVEKKEPEPVTEPEEPEDLPPPVPMSPVHGTVIDEGGRPLPDAEVTLKREGAPDVVERSFADGRFEFKDVPEGPVEVIIKTPGYDEVKLQFGEGEERKKEVILYPSLPAGQVKGEVRDMKGEPLPRTTITISPGDKAVEVSPEGTFSLELAPGRYTVRFEHPELSAQKRVIRVQDRGVVILNIALSP